MLADVVDRLGGLGILVGNAGVLHHGPSDRLSAADIDALFAVNICGPLLLVAARMATTAAAASSTSPPGWATSAAQRAASTR